MASFSGSVAVVAGTWTCCCCCRVDGWPWWPQAFVPLPLGAMGAGVKEGTVFVIAQWAAHSLSTE